MNLNDLMKLVNAGFTKEEILAMVGSQPAAPAPEPTPAPEPEKPAAPDPEPEKPAAPDPASDAIAKLTQQVTQLTTIVQQSNLLRAEQPNITPEKPEDIIASIIYPSFKKTE